MSLLSNVFSECKIIVRTKFFSFLFLILTLHIIIVNFYYCHTPVPQMLDYYIRIFGESIIPEADLLIIERDNILEIIRPIHPSTALLNPIYMFSTITLIPYVLICSMMIGIEFNNKTIRVKQYIHTPVRIFIHKLSAISVICILFVIYTVLINEILSLFLWQKVQNSYGFFLNKFNLDFNFSLSSSLKQLAGFILLLCGVSAFYGLISMVITYYSTMTYAGMIISVFPFLRFNSSISKIITAPMDAYYALLLSFIPREKQGGYVIPIQRFVNDNTIIAAVTAMLVISAVSLLIVKHIDKKI